MLKKINKFTDKKNTSWFHLEKENSFEGIERSLRRLRKKFLPQTSLGQSLNANTFAMFSEIHEGLRANSTFNPKVLISPAEPFFYAQNFGVLGAEEKKS